MSVVRPQRAISARVAVPPSSLLKITEYLKLVGAFREFLRVHDERQVRLSPDGVWAQPDGGRVPDFLESGIVTVNDVDAETSERAVASSPSSLRA